MSDITKCEGKNCKKKEKCFRYTAESGVLQSFDKFDEIEGECKYYLEN